MLTAGILYSQEKEVPAYCVYEIKGDVSLVVKAKKYALEPSNVLKGGDVLNLSQGSVIRFVDLQSRVMITLKGQCAGSLSSLILSQKASSRNMTNKYFAFVLNNLKGKGERAPGKVAAVFRGESDSLLLTLPDTLSTHTDIVK